MVPFSMTCNDPYRFQDHDILDVKQVYKPSVWRLCVLISHLFYVSVPQEMTTTPTVPNAVEQRDCGSKTVSMAIRTFDCASGALGVSSGMGEGVPQSCFCYAKQDSFLAIFQL